MHEQIRQALAPTGTLRAAINLGNAVLAQGDADAPRGITVDLARELARRLDVPLELRCVDAARKSVDAVASGACDIGFVAIDPARAEELAFTDPYVVIEALYAVPDGSDIASVADVDRPGVRVGVKLGSAYDLFLTRHLEHAELVRGDEGTQVFETDGLEVAAGIRQPLTAYLEARGRMRLVEPAFSQIQQAMALSRSRGEVAEAALRDFVTEVVESGFVMEALRRAGQDASLAATPAS